MTIARRGPFRRSRGPKVRMSAVRHPIAIEHPTYPRERDRRIARRRTRCLRLVSTRLLRLQSQSGQPETRRLKPEVTEQAQFGPSGHNASRAVEDPAEVFGRDPILPRPPPARIDATARSTAPTAPAEVERSITRAKQGLAPRERYRASGGWLHDERSG